GAGFRLLARMKRLRGSVLNPFGYHGEARLHRDLLAWYEAALDRIATAYAPEREADCTAILAAPMEIRGYGPVRVQAAQKVRAATDAALDRLN
ncbi:MAG: hypothetical protein QNK42_05130, partial [Pseudodonghicola sp.]|nr:hypothetical protein [Pseudodonghicola sp.]